MKMTLQNCSKVGSHGRNEMKMSQIHVPIKALCPAIIAPAVTWPRLRSRRCSWNSASAVRLGTPLLRICGQAFAPAKVHLRPFLRFCGNTSPSPISLLWPTARNWELTCAVDFSYLRIQPTSLPSAYATPLAASASSHLRPFPCRYDCTRSQLPQQFFKVQTRSVSNMIRTPGPWDPILTYQHIPKHDADLVEASNHVKQYQN